MVTTGTAIKHVSATRLYLNGQWSLDEFEILFRSFNDLYRLIAAFTVGTEVISSFVHVPVPFHRRRLNRVAREQEIPALQVLRIKYSSPGELDLVGIGKAAEVAKDILFGIADRIISREDRKLERDKKRLDNEARKSQIAREMAEADSKRERDNELHNLAIAERKIANERAQVALTSEQLDAAAKEVTLYNDILNLAIENGVSKSDISKMSSGFISKVAPIIPLILERKLLSEPSAEE